jgi:uncharacterized protein YjgD (DUF1641 family)
MSKVNYTVPYILWWNEKPYEVDKEIFSRFSKKFKDELKKPENANQMDIVVNNYAGEKVDDQTFIAFVNACQLRSFDVNKNNIYDLQHLASVTQWDVPSLRAFIEEHIAKNGIVPPDTVDYLGILIDKVEAQKDEYKDWENVANVVRSALKDPRFIEVPPDVIYEILDIAEKKGNIVGKELNAFILQTLDVKPETAIPLLLRADFEEFKPQDIQEIYEQPLVHTMNINFFTASALSALQNKNDALIKKSQRAQNLEFKCLEFAIDKMCEENKQKLQMSYKDEIDEIKDEIYRQHSIIEKLHERINAHKKRIQLAERKQISRREPIDEKIVEEMKNEVRRELDIMQEDITNALTKHDENIKKMLDHASEYAEKHFNEASTRSSNQLSNVQGELGKLINLGHETQEAIDAVNWQLGEARKSFCAKVARDKIRYDKFLRKTTNKFRIFDREPRLFNLTSTDVKKAEDFLIMVEKHIDEYCPLRQPEINPTPSERKRKKSQKK